MPPARRPRWWTELILVALVYAIYSSGRMLARGDVETAFYHGRRILEIEQFLHINPELVLNELVTKITALGVFFDFAYATLHYVVTPAVLIWVWRCYPARYRAARTWLANSTVLGLVGFVLMPTAPPRLLDSSYGFVDSMAQYASFGWWGNEASAPRGLGGMTNQYAAMPSLHVGWSVWCGVLLWRYAKTPFLRTLGVIYPLLTVVVVMATANHYLLDAVAGVVVMAIGLLLVRPVLRLTSRWRETAELRIADRQAARADALRTTTTTEPAKQPARTANGVTVRSSANGSSPGTASSGGASPGGRPAGGKPAGRGSGDKPARASGAADGAPPERAVPQPRSPVTAQQLSRRESVQEAEQGAGGSGRAQG